MFSKKPSFDESPLQDLSEDQMTQVAGGSSCSYKKEMNWHEWNNWKKHHHHHHNKPITVEVIVTFTNGSKKTYWEKDYNY
jgi:hypothetical protein